MKNVWLKRNIAATTLLLLIAITAESQEKQPINYSVYYGHIHNHSNYSDGSGFPAEAYQYARDIAGLDFFGLSDHALYLDSAKYKSTIDIANSYNKDGTYTTFYGFEWTNNSYGHITVVGADQFCQANQKETSTFALFLDWLKKHECIAFFNHPGRHDWSGYEFDHFQQTPLDKIVGIELWNKNNGFERYYYNNGYFEDDSRGYYEEAVYYGWRVGAAGAEDNHYASWGTYVPFRTAILADTLTREALYNAMKKRRFYSTEDKNLEISFTIDGNEMGAVIKAKKSKIIIHAKDKENEKFKTATLYKNGIEHIKWNLDSANITITDTISTQSGENYYVRITQEDNDEAVTSPIWIDGTYIPNKAPSSSLLYPLNNDSTETGNEITIIAKAEDLDGEVKKVHFYANDSLIGSSFGLIHMHNYTVAQGENKIYVTATDNDSATTQSDTILFWGYHASNKKPSVQITAPKDSNTFFIDSIITITIHATDNDGIIKQIEVFTNNSLYAKSSETPLILRYTIKNENTFIVAHAYDNDNEKTISETIQCFGIKRQNKIPIITLLAFKAEDNTDSITIEAEIKNIDGTIQAVHFFNNENLIKKINTPPYIIQCNTKEMTNIKAKAFFNISSSITSGTIKLSSIKTSIENNSEKDILVFPTIINNDKLLTIKTPHYNDTTFKIVSSDGNTLLETKLETSLTQLSVADMQKGWFCYTVENSHIIKHGTFIIE